MGWGGLIAFLGTCTPTWCYVGHGLGWSEAKNVLWHATVKNEYVATLAHVVNVREHKFDVTFIGYVATLAHAVDVCEHKFDVTFIEYVATLAHVVNVREPRTSVWCYVGRICCYACTYQIALQNGNQSFLPKKTNPMEEPAKIVGSGRGASSGGIILPSQVPSWKNFPNACGRVEKRCF